MSADWKGSKKTLEKYEDSGREKQVADVKKQIARIQKQRDESQTRIDQAVEAREASQLSDEEMIVEAYLRTLSRFPTESEVRHCHQFIADASSIAEGYKGVVWALLNTKEFIINH